VQFYGTLYRSVNVPTDAVYTIYNRTGMSDIGDYRNRCVTVLYIYIYGRQKKPYISLTDSMVMGSIYGNHNW
jgi:hypothetical protein